MIDLNYKILGKILVLILILIPILILLLLPNTLSLMFRWKGEEEERGKLLCPHSIQNQIKCSFPVKYIGLLRQVSFNPFIMR